MYDKVKWMGLTLPQWRERLNNVYNLGELYEMIQSGKKLTDLEQ